MEDEESEGKKYRSLYDLFMWDNKKYKKEQISNSYLRKALLVISSLITRLFLNYSKEFIKYI